ncbi:MAG: hypothetical protein HGA51_08685 [Demequinaceae bacterium]|nr:hypothetical protein [Demequinaceae bacterium]
MTVQKSIKLSTESDTDPALPASFAPRIGPRTVVSSLWLFAVLNYLYCDVLGLMYPPDLQAYLDGKIGGISINQGFLLAAGVLMTIPMSAVLVSRIAPHRLARWWSIVAGAVMTLVQVGTLGVGSGVTAHYAYFSVIEVATTVAIVWVAARRWKVDA